MAEENEDNAEDGAGTENADGAGSENTDSASLLDQATKTDTGEGGEGEGGEGVARDGDKDQAPALLTERPSYLPERFWPKDAGDGIDASALLEKMSGSYAELESKFKAGGHKAPKSVDDYKIEVTDDLKDMGVEEIESDHPIFKGFMEEAHALGLGNEAVNRLINKAMEIAVDTDGVPVDPEVAAAAEIKALGKGGQALIDGLDGWVTGLKNQGILSEDEFAAARGMARSADEVRVLAKLRELSGEQVIPMDTVVEDGLPSKEEAYAMTSDPKYGVDKAFTAKVDLIFEKLFGTQDAGTSQAGIGTTG